MARAHRARTGVDDAGGASASLLQTVYRRFGPSRLRLKNKAQLMREIVMNRTKKREILNRVVTTFTDGPNMMHMQPPIDRTALPQRINVRALALIAEIDRVLLRGP